MDVSYKYTTVCAVECLVGGKVDVDGFFLLLVICECGSRSLAFLIISFLIQARALLLCEEANVVVSRRGEPQLQVEILVVVEGSFLPGTQTGKLTTYQINRTFSKDLCFVEMLHLIVFSMS